MNTRTIPNDIPSLVQACARALAGAQSLGATLELAQNTAARIATDYHDFVGEPGAAVNNGKQAALNERRAAITEAQATRRQVIADGRKFCSDAVDLLKARLGRTWNPRWQAAGFSRFSIQTSRAKPYPVLLELRNYFRTNPTHENTPGGITADTADAKAALIVTAEQAVDAARSARTSAATARDASKRQLRHRLTALREELDLILDPADPRWYDFGFSRPVDSRMPEPVSGLTIVPGLAGQVNAQWEASARAVNYRVSWAIQGSSEEPTEVGLFADLSTTLSGLPSGATVVVIVTARNDSGETQPATAVITVP